MSACISDYDLFSVFPKKFSKIYDKRSVPQSDIFKVSKFMAHKYMHADFGNTTPRVTFLVQALNKKINYFIQKRLKPFILDFFYILFLTLIKTV